MPFGAPRPINLVIYEAKSLKKSKSSEMEEAFLRAGLPRLYRSL